MFQKVLYTLESGTEWRPGANKPGRKGKKLKTIKS